MSKIWFDDEDRSARARVWRYLSNAWYNVTHTEVGHRIRDSYWWLIHRIIPRHRYHTLPTGLLPGYWDPDTRIIYAIFTQVSDFVKNSGTDWSYSQHHKEVFEALSSAAAWWEENKDEHELYDDIVEHYEDSVLYRHLTNIIKYLPNMWY